MKKNIIRKYKIINKNELFKNDGMDINVFIEKLKQIKYYYEFDNRKVYIGHFRNSLDDMYNADICIYTEYEDIETDHEYNKRLKTEETERKLLAELKAKYE